MLIDYVLDYVPTNLPFWFFEDINLNKRFCCIYLNFKACDKRSLKAGCIKELLLF